MSKIILDTEDFFQNDGYDDLMHIDHESYCCGEMFEKYETKISDLEAKLAEHNEYFNLFACKDFNEFKDFISTFMLTPHEEQTLIQELKQQLAEKDAELEQKNKLIIQENGECILCGDCYCINNDVRKIVEENKQLSQIQKQEIIWLKEFDGLFEKGKDYKDVWQFLIDRITLVNGERYAD